MINAWSPAFARGSLSIYLSTRITNSPEWSIQCPNAPFGDCYALPGSGHVGSVLLPRRTRRARRKSEHEPLHSVFQLGYVEVHQQADRDLRPFHLGQQWCLVNSQSLLNALQLDKELILHQNVNTVSTVEENVFASNWLCKLQLKGNMVATQFMCPAWFID